MEDEIRRIRTILSTPSLRLSIFPVGLGRLPIVNSAALPDLTGGPFPENIKVSPVASNEAIMVSGSFRFDISHCSPYIARDLVQYNSGIEYAIDEEGNISFTVDTTFQSRTPIINKTYVNYMGADISKQIGSVFAGFKRKTKLSFSRDQRIARIKTELREIPSDAAFAPRTKHIEFDDEIEGSLFGGDADFATGGFYKWQRNMTCTITLPHRLNKIWAWYVFRQLFLHRLKGIRAHAKANAKADVQPTPNQVAEVATDEKKKSWYLLTHFKIKNPLFSRSITFESQYLMAMTLSDILANKCNIFTTVRHNIAPEFDDQDPPQEVPNSDLFLYDPNATDNRDLSDEWDYWNRAEEKSLKGVYNYVNSGPITYAQCSISANEIIPSKMRINTSKDKFGEQEPPVSSERYFKEVTGMYNEPQKSWLKYDNATEIIQTNNNEQVDYIQNAPIENYQSLASTAPVSASQGFQINHEVSGAEDISALPETVVFGTATNKIRMKGHAIRIGYQIPCPALVAYNGVAVERIGTARFSHKTLNTSAIILVEDPDNPLAPPQEVPMPMYLAMWDVTYAINQNIRTNDILGKILSSGSPSVYET